MSLKEFPSNLGPCQGSSCREIVLSSTLVPHTLSDWALTSSAQGTSHGGESGGKESVCLLFLNLFPVGLGCRRKEGGSLLEEQRGAKRPSKPLLLSAARSLTISRLQSSSHSLGSQPVCSQTPLARSPGSLWPWVAPTWGPAAVMKGTYVCACVSNRLKNELCCLRKASNRPHIDLWMVILKQALLLCRRAHSEDRVIVGQWLPLHAKLLRSSVLLGTLRVPGDEASLPPLAVGA